MRSRLHPFLRSDGGERVWSIEQTFVPALASVGMKIRPHVNCEYCILHLRYYSLEDGK